MTNNVSSDREGRRAFSASALGAAFALLLAAPSARIQAQGLRPSSATVTFVVTKPATATIRDVDLAIPMEWRSASDISARWSSTTTTAIPRTHRLFVRDSDHRLMELDPQAAPVAAAVSPAGTIAFRVIDTTPDRPAGFIVQLEASWPDGRHDTRALPVRLDAPRP